MPISRCRGARAGPLNRAIKIPEQFSDIESYYESHGPLTPSAFRAYTDDLRGWLEVNYRVPVSVSSRVALQVMKELKTLPVKWLDYAAEQGIGAREWVFPTPTVVEESEPVETESKPIDDVVVPVRSTYDEIMEQIRRKPKQQ